jgi:drug/metabolite transporter (DMT)-like permease
VQRFRSADAIMMGVLSLFWGLGFVFIKIGLDSFSPLAQGAARYYIAGAVLLVVAAVRGRRLLPRDARSWAAVLVAAVLNTFGYTALLNWGEQYTTAGIVAVIVGLNPVITTVFTRAILPEDRVGVAGLAGLGLGLAGIVALVGLKPGQLLDAQGLGELAVVAAIASWALGSVVVRRLSHTMDLFAFVGWNILLGGVICHLGALAFEGGGRWVLDAPGIESILYLAIFSSAAGFALYYTLLHRVGPIRTNLVSHLAPIVTNVTGFVVLKNPFEWRALLAFALILSGFVLVARHRPVPPPVEEALPAAEGAVAAEAVSEQP